MVTDQQDPPGYLPEEHILHNVLASMPVAVAWANPRDGRIEFINRKFTSMFGYGMDDLGTVHEWVMACYADPGQARKIDDFWNGRLLADTDETVEMEDVELDIRCKDGSIKTVLSGKIVLPHRSGALATFLDITPRKKKESLIQRQAMEDPLTGLLNRRAFTQRMEESLQECKANNSMMALMLIDLDGFKPVNDTYGHDQGDALLLKVARRLQQAVREQDALCRIGGDEFGVVLGCIHGEETARVIAERILYGMRRRPYTLGGREVAIGASIGIALYPEDSATEHGLFRHADQALYKAKSNGKGRWCR